MKTLDKVEAEVKGVLDPRLRQYQMNLLSISDEKEEAAGKKAYEEFAKRKEDAMAEVAKRRNELTGVNSAAAEESKKPKGPGATLQQIDAHGTDVQNKSVDAALRIQRTLAEDKKTADNIIVKIEENTEKLLVIEDAREQMDSTMGRVKKHINFFMRSLASDKLMMCLIFTALIGIVVAVVCYFIFGSSSSSSD